jgi:hypothetical protein
MKKVPLRDGGYAIVDDRDYEKTLQYTWRIVRKGPQRDLEYVIASEAPVYLHRLVFGRTTKAHVDHINGNCRDNRRRNLRGASVKENVRNSSKYRWRDGRPTSSKFKGVYIDRRETPLSKPWVARIGVDSKHKNLGRFATPEEAAHRYDEAARVIFGTFARLNFPRGREQGAAR